MSFVLQPGGLIAPLAQVGNVIDSIVDGGAILIEGGPDLGSGSTGNVTVRSQTNPGVGNGGGVAVIGGDSSGAGLGGQVNITGGQSATFLGGGIAVQAGGSDPAVGFGGAINIASGSAGFSGAVDISSGSAGVDAGAISLIAGGSTGTGKGGGINLTTGDSPAGHPPGHLTITLGTRPAGTLPGQIRIGAANGGSIADAPNGQVVNIALRGPGGAAVTANKWVRVVIDGVGGWIPFFS